jgi:hypothetical protein
MLCTHNDGEVVMGVSLIDASSPRTCDLRDCGVIKTLDPGRDRSALLGWSTTHFAESRVSDGPVDVRFCRLERVDLLGVARSAFHKGSPTSSPAASRLDIGITLAVSQGAVLRTPLYLVSMRNPRRTSQRRLATRRIPLAHRIRHMARGNHRTTTNSSDTASYRRSSTS